MGFLTSPESYDTISFNKTNFPIGGRMSIFRFIWWAMIISLAAFAGYVYGYLSE